jgi:hypothetical protein
VFFSYKSGGKRLGSSLGLEPAGNGLALGNALRLGGSIAGEVAKTGAVALE